MSMVGSSDALDMFAMFVCVILIQNRRSTSFVSLSFVLGYVDEIPFQDRLNVIIFWLADGMFVSMY